MAGNPFDTTLGTGPASWYPTIPTALNNAAAAPAAGLSDPTSQAEALGIAPASSAASTAAPALSLGGSTPTDFASLFPYLKLGLQGAGFAGNQAGIPGAGGIASGLGGLLNIGMGAATGNPGQAAQGALGALGGANSAYGALTNTAGGFLGGASPYLAPLGAFLGGLFGASPRDPAAADSLSKSNMQTIGMSTLAPLLLSGAIPAISATLPALASTLAALTPALGPAAVVAAPALAVGLALNQAFNPKTNYGINKMAGQVGPSATAGIGETARIANQFTGDINSVSTNDLAAYINQVSGALANRYSPAGVGTGTSGSTSAASRYLDGLAKNDPTAFAQSNKDLETTKNALLSAVKTLQSRGVSDTELGALAPKVWGSQDFGGTTLPQLFNTEQKATASGPATVGTEGTMLGDPGGAAVPYLYHNTPDTVNSITGGPLWSEMAYLFGPSTGNPGNDPRVGAGYWDALQNLGVKAPQLNQAAMAPTADMLAYRNLINQQLYQGFTSGGA